MLPALVVVPFEVDHHFRVRVRRPVHRFVPIAQGDRGGIPFFIIFVIGAQRTIIVANLFRTSNIRPVGFMHDVIVALGGYLSSAFLTNRLFRCSVRGESTGMRNGHLDAEVY